MEEKIKLLIKKLREKNMTISAMESCSGGSFCNSLTNIENASDVFMFGAITYSNLFKIKMGVKKKTINKYSVYSIEVAKEMAKRISLYATSSIGVGITGKLNKPDKNNLYGEDNIVYVSLYEKCSNKYKSFSIEVNSDNRVLNKEMVISKIIDELLLFI